MKAAAISVTAAKPVNCSRNTLQVGAAGMKSSTKRNIPSCPITSIASASAMRARVRCATLPMTIVGASAASGPRGRAGRPPPPPPPGPPVGLPAARPPNCPRPWRPAAGTKPMVGVRGRGGCCCGDGGEASRRGCQGLSLTPPVLCACCCGGDAVGPPPCAPAGAPLELLPRAASSSLSLRYTPHWLVSASTAARRRAATTPASRGAAPTSAAAPVGAPPPLPPLFLLLAPPCADADHLSAGGVGGLTFFSFFS